VLIHWLAVVIWLEPLGGRVRWGLDQAAAANSSRQRRS
jgi:hypothetical protein